MSGICECCNRPLPLDAEELRLRQEREFWEYEVTGVLGPKLAEKARAKAEHFGSKVASESGQESL